MGYDNEYSGIEGGLEDLIKGQNRIIELLEKLVSAKTEGAMPGYERVYSYTGPNGSTVIYPSDQPHYRKIKP